MMRSIRRLALLALLLTAVPLWADEGTGKFFFRKGDRVVFLGDSITAQYQYSSYIELYLTTRHPNWGMSFLNAGIGGDTAHGGAGRFQSQILDEKPTAVTIDFGMNDGGYGGFDAKRAAHYISKTKEMLKAAQKAGARVALISPNAVEVRSNPGLKTYLQTQKQFYAGLEKLAAKHKVPFVDQYAVTRKVLDKMAEDGAKVKPFPDGVHTNEAGGLLMAHTILVGLHAPAAVSDVSIDAKTQAVQSTRCKVGDLSASETRVTFERTDEAVPMPVIPNWRGLLPYVDELKDLNYYGLKVTGLSAGKYTLSIDGKSAGTYTAEQLASGVNLGNLTSGPLYDQGKKVLDAINAKNNLVAQRFHGVLRFQAPDWLADVVKERKPAELKKRKALIDAKQAEVYKLAQPVAHKFELKAAK